MAGFYHDLINMVIPSSVQTLHTGQPLHLVWGAAMCTRLFSSSGGFLATFLSLQGHQCLHLQTLLSGVLQQNMALCVWYIK